jgi:hypothetical protein
MKTVRVGYSRLYNARGCSLLGRDEVLLRFTFGAIDVEAYVGPNKRHTILGFKVGPPLPKDPTVRERMSQARGYDWPPPEKFPADLYTELVATEAIEIDDALAAAFHGRDEAARDEMLCIARERESSLITALDYVAGILGLRLHSLLVRTPITEQHYAYRDKDAPYAVSASLHLKVGATYKWDVSDEGLTATKSKMPTLRRGWTWEKAAEVLAWLLRAWAAEDPVLEFVSLFIPLECVIPELPIVGKGAWDQKRSAVLAIIEKEASAQDRNELSNFLADLRSTPPPLASRFKKWATDAALPGWEQDVAAFAQFNRMRNLLVHAGNRRVKSRITVAADDVRTLEDIAARYVSLALFGDANVYQIPRHAMRV